MCHASVVIVCMRSNVHVVMCMCGLYDSSWSILL